MHHEAASGGIELVTGLSYLMILLGFALRQYLESSTTRLLWPWMLVSIFGLCGLTRLDYVGVIAAPELLVTSFHLLLATIALAYGVGQLLYAFWPELFEADTPMPQLARGDLEENVPAEAADPNSGYEPQVVAPQIATDRIRT